MKILFDTSVFVAALVKPHPFHHQAFRRLKQAHDREIELIVSSHTLAELYHVLTRFPVKPRFLPGSVKRIIQENIVKIAAIISLTPEEYMQVIEKTADYNLAGGIIFDAIICMVAEKMAVDKLLTFNANNFERLLPHKKEIISKP
jgi:predicted nucleic acid-binding protein